MVHIYWREAGENSESLCSLQKGGTGEREKAPLGGIDMIHTLDWYGNGWAGFGKELQSIPLGLDTNGNG